MEDVFKSGSLNHFGPRKGPHVGRVTAAMTLALVGRGGMSPIYVRSRRSKFGPDTLEATMPNCRASVDT